MIMNSSPTPNREVAIHAFERLVSALRSTIDTLNHELSVSAVLIEGLQSSTSLVNVARDAEISVERARLTDSITELESARYYARECYFQALNQEGASIGQISRLWGISRQLASRILKKQPGTSGQPTTLAGAGGSDGPSIVI